MLIYLFPCDTFFGVCNHTFFNKILGIVSNINCLIVWSSLPNHLQQLIISFGIIGVHSIHHLIEHNTNRPNICLETVLLLFQNLGCHSQRSSANSFSKLIFLHLDRKPQISYLTLPVVNKHISTFEISMHSMHLMQTL